MLKHVSNFIKGFCAGILGLSLGFVLADEIEQRALRAKLRDACKTELNSQLPPELQEAMANMVDFKCRAAIP